MPDSQADSDSGDTVPGVPAEDDLPGLLTAWTSAATWEDSEAFLASHTEDLLTLAGYATLGQLAAARPGDDRLALHTDLLSAVLAQASPARTRSCAPTWTGTGTPACWANGSAT